MNTLSLQLKKHPISILFLLMYTLLCVRAVNVHLQMMERIKQHPDMGDVAAGGEVVQYAYIFLIITGAVFFFISSGYAIAKPAETKFYLCAIFIMIFETIIAILMG